MAAHFMTSVTSGLTVIVSEHVTRAEDAARTLGGLLLASRPCDIAEVAAASGPLRHDIAAVTLAPGSPTAVTRECFLAGQPWDASTRPTALTTSHCLKDVPDHAWTEPLIDWVCARNVLLACCTMLARGDEGLGDRLRSCGGAAEGGRTRIPLARDPRRRNFRLATGTVSAADESVLLALRSAASGHGCEVSTVGQLEQLVLPSTQASEVTETLLGIAWDALAQVRPEATSDGGAGGEARLVGRDLLGSLVLAVVEHPGMRIHRCRNCGRPFLAGTARASYCSPSCRTAGFRQRG